MSSINVINICTNMSVIIITQQIYKIRYCGFLYHLNTRAQNLGLNLPKGT